MFHTGFVIHDDVIITCANTIDDRAQHVIGRAVTSLAFGPAHGQHVKVVAFFDGHAHRIVQPVLAGQAHCRTGLDVLARLLAQLTYRLAQGQPQDEMQITAGIGIDGQDVAQSMLDQVTGQQSG